MAFIRPPLELHVGSFDLAMLPRQVADLTALGPVNVARDLLASLVRVKMPERAAAVAIWRDWAVVDVVI